MKGRRELLLLGAAVAVSLGLGYGAGRASGLSAARIGEATSDVLVPASDGLRTRNRRASIRSETLDLAARQLEAYARDSVFTELGLERGDHIFVVEDRVGHVFRYNHRRHESVWMAVVRHRDSPIGEVCAVALNREPAYLGGVPLPREGRVRCSWDLATRINRWRG